MQMVTTKIIRGFLSVGVTTAHSQQLAINVAKLTLKDKSMEKHLSEFLCFQEFYEQFMYFDQDRGGET
jgi:hypothetical protein